MNSIKAIRERLGLTQSAMGDAIGCTQGNVGHYERGQTVPPDVAGKLIAFAETKGVKLTYDAIYAAEPPEPKTFTRPNGEVVTDQRKPETAKAA